MVVQNRSVVKGFFRPCLGRPPKSADRGRAGFQDPGILARGRGLRYAVLAMETASDADVLVEGLRPEKYFSYGVKIRLDFVSCYIA